MVIAFLGCGSALMENVMLLYAVSIHYLLLRYNSQLYRKRKPAFSVHIKCELNNYSIIKISAVYCNGFENFTLICKDTKYDIKIWRCNHKQGYTIITDLTKFVGVYKETIYIKMYLLISRQDSLPLNAIKTYIQQRIS